MSKNSKVPKMRRGSFYYDEEFNDDKFFKYKKKNKRQFKRDR